MLGERKLERQGPLILRGWHAGQSQLARRQHLAGMSQRPSTRHQRRRERPRVERTLPVRQHQLGHMCCWHGRHGPKPHGVPPQARDAYRWCIAPNPGDSAKIMIALCQARLASRLELWLHACDDTYTEMCNWGDIHQWHSAFCVLCRQSRQDWCRRTHATSGAGRSSVMLSAAAAAGSASHPLEAVSAVLPLVLHAQSLKWPPLQHPPRPSRR
jgi:hypothetical protein